MSLEGEKWGGDPQGRNRCSIRYRTQKSVLTVTMGGEAENTWSRICLEKGLEYSEAVPARRERHTTNGFSRVWNKEKKKLPIKGARHRAYNVHVADLCTSDRDALSDEKTRAWHLTKKEKKISGF